MNTTKQIRAIVLGAILTLALAAWTSNRAVSPPLGQGSETSCPGCTLIRNPPGDDTDVVMVFVPRPDPTPGEEHGDGSCEIINNNCLADAPCKIDGVIGVTNNTGGTITVKVPGQSPDKVIEDGEEEGVNIEYRPWVCGALDFKVSVFAENGAKIANYVFECTECVNN